LFAFAMVGVALAFSCGAGGAGDSSGAPGFPGGSAGTTGSAGSFGGAGTTGFPGTGSGGSTGSAGSTSPPLPPEQEVESTYEVPVATGRFVWTVNSTSGRVAYVDAETLAVHTVEAGDGPSAIAAVPSADADAVVVLNALSRDATFLRARAGAATLESRTFPALAAGSNSWAVSPDGRYAVAWTDARRLATAPKTQGFHEVTILDLAAAANVAGTTTLAVGYRPASFAFSADSKKAYAVTEDGVSVVSLADRVVVATVPLGADGQTTDSEDTRDVSITADGRLAVVRRDGSATVGVVDLDARTRVAVTLGSAVTDVDVSKDGARGVAVARDAGEVAVFPLAGAAPAPAAVAHLQVPGATIGQVAISDDGKTAVLYSNAVAAERLMVVSLLGTPAVRAVKLHAPVLSAFPTADGKFAVVLHPIDGALPQVPVGGADGGVAPAPAGPPPAAVAFSLAPLDGSQPARIEMADAPIRAVALSPAGDRALVTVRDDAKAVFGTYMGLFPTLEVRGYPLASPPIATGVVGRAKRGYVAQQHPDGRITFLSLDDGGARTLTGYELGARVVDWSRP
jgi:DNA-binding beta-propeller fold protein YncE